MNRFLFTLAWRNLWRHPKRTLMTMLAMLLSTSLFIFMLAFQLGSYDSMKINSLSLQDGFGQFQHPDYLDTPSLRHSFEISAEFEQHLTQRLLQQPGLNVGSNLVMGYRTQAFGLLSAGEQNDLNQGAMVMGVQPAIEPQLSKLPSLVTQGRFLNEQDRNAILIGEALAQLLQVTVGDEIQLLGQDKVGSLAADLFTVVGLFNSGQAELDRQTTFIPFNYAQTLFALENQAHQLALVTEPFQTILTLEPALEALAQQHGLMYRNWEALQPGVAQGIKLDYYSGFIWYVAILLIVVLILFNTLLMSVLEREREFGLMLSLGLSRRQLALLSQLETQFTLLLGIGLGLLGGIGLTLYFYQTGITIPGTDEMFAQYGMSSTIYPNLTAMALWFAPGFLWLSTWLLSSLLVWRIYRLHPLSGRQTK